jgi:hypothetical protein
LPTALLLITLLGTPPLVHAQNTTGQAMRAQRAKQAVKLRILPTKVIEVAVDDKQNFAPLKKDQTFTTTGPVAVTVERPNPLTLLVTAEVAEADDPSHATVGKLLEALIGAAGTIRPGAKGPTGDAARMSVTAFGNVGTTCKNLKQATDLVNELDTNLYSAVWSRSHVLAHVKNWAAQINRGHAFGVPGPAAIQLGIDAIDLYLKPKADPADMTAPIDVPGDILEAAVAAVEKALKAKADGEEDKACLDLANTVYAAIRLTNPQSRLADVQRLYSSVVELRSLLETQYANPANWFGEDARKTGYYVKRAVEPSSEKMQVVSVKVQVVDYTGLDVVTPVLLAKREDLLTASFIIRQYSFFVPEIGGGVTFTRFDRRTYATSKNDAGETVVGESIDELTVDPTVMVNFVVRNYPGAFLTPMVQVGVSTSKDTPTIFLGGGLRFLHLGKGDFAFGAGAAFPWTKQLKTLAPNVVVKGQKDIDDDLEFRSAGVHLFWSLQYKF